MASRGHDEVVAWFRSRVPSTWFDEPVIVHHDREEIVVVGVLADPEPAEDDAERCTVARRTLVGSFRDASRDDRVAIASDAEALWGRKVSWGVRCGTEEVWFTNAAVPVMTRLRMPERAVLDTLIDAGVARSRSEALAWCVRLVGRHEGDWLAELREALAAVEAARAAGPDHRG